jgi:7-cyano-7-deazaguanine synthase in queuosine biosynthesis
VFLLQGEGLPDGARAAAESRAAWTLDWRSDRRNAVLDCAGLPLPDGEDEPLALDLLDVATAIYLADLAVKRGENEEWVRQVGLTLAVREPDFWDGQKAALERLLQRMTGDNFGFSFHSRQAEGDAPPAAGETWVHTDSVCLLSGGLDSAGGAAMLLRTERCPRLVMHRSGNPAVAQAQDRVTEIFGEKWPDQFRLSQVRLAPSSHRTGAVPFPVPAERETSRRCRSLLFMTLGALAAQAEGVEEVYLCDNCLLTSAVPLTEARSGSFTTHSTHPAVLAEFSGLLEQAGWPVRVLNPFACQAKGEIIRTFLQPVLNPAEIGQTVSCWAIGRQQRQCGGCLPCLLRRIGLLAAGQPEDVYGVDVLAHPQSLAGTDAYRNLVDLLAFTSRVLSTPELRLGLEFPALLEVAEGGAQVLDLARGLRRQATEIFEVIHRCFPAAAQLMGELR